MDGALRRSKKEVLRKTPLPHVQPSVRGGTGSESLRGTPSVELTEANRGRAGLSEKLAHPSELRTSVNARTASENDPVPRLGIRSDRLATRVDSTRPLIPRVIAGTAPCAAGSVLDWTLQGWRWT